MEMTLEVIPLPVSDIDRAKKFYVEKVGFHCDVDREVMPGARIVQLTPPGSGCSIVLTAGFPFPTGAPAPGTYHGLQLVVSDIEAAREELTGRGVDVSEPVRFGSDDGGTFMYFSDPDGNGWAVQEYRRRATVPLRDAISPPPA
ncbi:VOC family protein [Streptomyces sp. VRA16 Mangrove soil]|uniref:VOC family protein n=1 Tax=Streptomyces sp. VRA16 Mangrove soil TaxID=2817434 RepID=UPI001A9F7165|nr:VOC family protein [Streptomyces sp. VRA16 Mangrove soil]MBO1333253.1 VOC family protein [Streptomyces sp. VRA16 Mangrove soil]